MFNKSSFQFLNKNINIKKSMIFAPNPRVMSTRFHQNFHRHTFTFQN